MFDFIENCFRYKSEIVIYEAVYVIVNLKNIFVKELVFVIFVF